MSEKIISKEFILKNIDETRNYFIEEINKIDLMSKNYKKVFATLDYVNTYLF